METQKHFDFKLSPTWKSSQGESRLKGSENSEIFGKKTSKMIQGE